MIEVTNKSGEPVTIRLRSGDIELNPGESYEVQGYAPRFACDCSPLAGSEALVFWPSRDPASPRTAQGWLAKARPDGVGSEPRRSSREKP